MWQARLKREVDVIHDPCFSILGRTSPHIQGGRPRGAPLQCKKSCRIKPFGHLAAASFFFIMNILITNYSTTKE